MRFYFIKTPRILKRLFAKYTWSFFSDRKEIFLTFDDGPIPEVTEFVLDQLKQFNAKATFFCIGDNIQKHPAVFSRIVKEGHSVGNHTFNHLNGWKNSDTTYIENTSKCESLLPRQKTKSFRPPYGKIKRKQAKQLLANGYKIIMWDVLSADFDPTITKKECLKNVLNNTQNGSIIVFHDSIKASEKLYYALPKILREFSERGYEFKAIN
ncbi:peptidoglycan/xylan/chitin deacetylase (PgdA/CDA1 family) [Tenacibaculum lutimaris]|uniref:Peptidoglycan/xylan/chitin deacetylase (PgdA/CDA1 family) n=1 Tax=Tenacibaculum lutimaris TaxID=285258 RepID=A0A420E553_9FLAO|nr:polysaccharide deacetylase family protein [Tenacibaculum lutimaris]RKF05007.1 peptidoglycan/xylan/chitin deacetylase (PgdA/CDA1 family) [Tenacibaculum lutimaris]